jgi:hypothetical protein
MRKETAISNGFVSIGSIDKNIECLCKLDTVDGEQFVKYMHFLEDGNSISGVQIVTINELNIFGKMRDVLLKL